MHKSSATIKLLPIAAYKGKKKKGKRGNMMKQPFCFVVFCFHKIFNLKKKIERKQFYLLLFIMLFEIWTISVEKDGTRSQAALNTH